MQNTIKLLYHNISKAFDYYILKLAEFFIFNKLFRPQPFCMITKRFTITHLLIIDTLPNYFFQSALSACLTKLILPF